LEEGESQSRLKEGHYLLITSSLFIYIFYI